MSQDEFVKLVEDEFPDWPEEQIQMWAKVLYPAIVQAKAEMDIYWDEVNYYKG